MKEGHLAYLACSSVIMESLVKGHVMWHHRATHPCAAQKKKKKSYQRTTDQKLTTKKAQVLRLNTFPPNAKNGSLSFGCLQSVYSRFNTFSP